MAMYPSPLSPPRPLPAVISTMGPNSRLPVRHLLAMAPNSSSVPSPYRRPFSILDSNAPVHHPSWSSSNKKRPLHIAPSLEDQGHVHQNDACEKKLKPGCKGIKRKSQEAEVGDLRLSIGRSADLHSVAMPSDFDRNLQLQSATPTVTLYNNECADACSILVELPQPRLDMKDKDKKSVCTIPTILCSSKRPPTYPKKEKLDGGSQQIPRHTAKTASFNSSTSLTTNSACYNAIAEFSFSIATDQRFLQNRVAEANNRNFPIPKFDSFIKSEQYLDEDNLAREAVKNDQMGTSKCWNWERTSGICKNWPRMKEQFSKIAGFSEMKPGIIRKLRCRGQVRAAIAAMIGASNTSSSSPHHLKGQESVAASLALLDHRKHANGSAAQSSSGCFRSAHDVSDQEAADSVSESLERVEVRRMQKRRQQFMSSSSVFAAEPGRDGSPATAPAPSFPVGNMIPCWLELLRLDIKGRLSALKRSRKRVRGVILSSDFDNMGSARRGSNSDCRAASMELKKWKDFFLHMDDALCSEGNKLETWLRQVVEMQKHSQNKGSAPPPWEMTACFLSATSSTLRAEALGSNLTLPHSAAKTTQVSS